MGRFFSTLLFWIVPSSVATFGLWIGLLFLEPSRDTLGLNRTLSTQCNSMIFGTSRSAQGVNPEIIEGLHEPSGKWLNFSFNLGVSPWNQDYVEAIKNKVRCSLDTVNPSVFLLFVDPWGLDEVIGAGYKTWLTAEWANVCDMNVAFYALEKTNPIDIMTRGSGHNLITALSRIIKNLTHSFSSTKSNKTIGGVKKNGWLPNVAEKTIAQKEAAINEKVRRYELEKTKGDDWPGAVNHQGLNSCIEMLKNSSPQVTIILVRPPVAEKMRNLEDDWFPQANQFLQELAAGQDIRFIDAHQQWQEKELAYFNDGHHMSVEGANAFSAFLAKAITFD